MHKVGGASGCAADLTVILLAEVLQHAPQQQRLTQSALVCSAWAAAAAQATVDVECKLTSETVPAFESWMALHAGQLSGLKVKSDSIRVEHLLVLKLPSDKLTKLQRLELGHVHVQLPGEWAMPSSSTAANSTDSSSAVRAQAVQSPLSSLQHLKLKYSIVERISSLLQLTNAPQLSTLELCGISFELVGDEAPAKWCNMTEAAMQQLAEAIPRLLQQMPQLTLLDCYGIPFNDAAAHQTASMQQLQHLFISDVEHVPLGNLQHLPSSLTKLIVIGPSHTHTHQYDSPTLPAELPQLSRLLDLSLHRCAMHPKVLSSFTQLQRLELEHCTLLPNYVAYTNSPEGTAALLGALGSLTSLQHLILEDQNLDTASTPPALFAGLAASSHLTALQLRHEWSAPIPLGAVQHMFAPSRQMPCMQLLSIRNLDYDSEDWCVDGADIECIIDCCPGLQSLELLHVVPQNTDLSVLRHLPKTCTTLRVGGAAFCDEVAPVVAHLTQLQFLDWAWSSGLTDLGLEQLTVLVGLGQLYATHCGISHAITKWVPSCDGYWLELSSDPQLGTVSQQLDALCDLSPVLAHRRFKKYKKTAKAEIKRLRKQVSSLQQQLAAAQSPKAEATQ